MPDGSVKLCPSLSPQCTNYKFTPQLTDKFHAAKTLSGAPTPSATTDAAFHHLGQIHRDFEERHFTSVFVLRNRANDTS